MKLHKRNNELRNLINSTIIDVDSHETEKEVWTLYIYLSQNNFIHLLSLNIISPKGENGPTPAFSFSDLLDPKLWMMIVVAFVAIWFTSKKTNEIQNQRSKKEQESFNANNKQKNTIDDLSKKLDDMNKKFSSL